ncbi:hypothetical protein Tco_0665647 [Tanacetum coccineum]
MLSKLNQRKAPESLCPALKLRYQELSHSKRKALKVSENIYDEEFDNKNSYIDDTCYNINDNDKPTQGDDKDNFINDGSTDYYATDDEDTDEEF